MCEPTAAWRLHLCLLLSSFCRQKHSESRATVQTRAALDFLHPKTDRKEILLLPAHRNVLHAGRYLSTIKSHSKTDFPDGGVGVRMRLGVPGLLPEQQLSRRNHGGVGRHPGVRLSATTGCALVHERPEVRQLDSGGYQARVSGRSKSSRLIRGCLPVEYLRVVRKSPRCMPGVEDRTLIGTNVDPRSVPRLQLQAQKRREEERMLAATE